MNFNKNKIIKKKLDVKLTKSKIFFNFFRFSFNIKKSLGKDKNGLLLYHRGGGVKKKYRLLFSNTKKMYYRILSINYDPYRSAFIKLIQYKDGSICYKLAESSDHLNYYKNNSTTKKITIGTEYLLQQIPTKSLIYNLEKLPGKKQSIGKAAGSYCKIFRKNESNAEILLPSGEKKLFSLKCKATLGIPSNVFSKLNKKYKAGTNRYLNKRPIVRGVAMNPIDHPHGGGEGKTSGGRPSTSPWGKLTKNVPTRKNK